MGEKSNAERFLAAYQTIDEIVRKNANDVPEAKLVDVIPKAALSNYVIHMFTLSLQSLAEIRNAIVCDTDSSVILAEPSDAVVTEIENVREHLLRRHSALEFAKAPVRTVTPETKVTDAFDIMKSLDTTKIPVYSGTDYKGFLTMESFSYWCMAHPGSDASVKDVMNTHNAKDTVLFADRNREAQSALLSFMRQMWDGHNLLAILITGTGKPGEAPIGILTVSDLPKIVEAYK